MTDTLERLSSSKGEGNFWRRVGALVIDWAIVGVGLCVIAVLGYGVTGGQIRMAQAPMSFTSCLPAEAAPQGFDPAAPIPGVAPEAQREIMGDITTFRADVVTDCRVSILGSEIDRKANIAETAATQRFFIMPVDDQVRITWPWLYLDHLYGLVMLTLLALLEGLTGASFGKRVVRLKVQSRKGGAAGLGRAFVRNLILWGPAAFLGLIAIGASHNLFVFGGATGLAMGAAGIALALGLWPFVLLMGLLASGAAPFWDQIAGVRVVRY